MSEYKISNDFLEIITGTSNKLHPAYMEASKNIENNIIDFSTNSKLVENKD